MSDLFPPMRYDEISREQLTQRVQHLEFVVEALIRFVEDEQKVELRYLSQFAPSGLVVGSFMKHPKTEGEK